MNMRVKKPVVVAADFSGPRSAPGSGRVAQASVVAITDGVAALAFDTGAGDLAARGAGRLGGEIAGRRLPRPLVSTRLPLRRGGLRHVLLIAQDAEQLARSTCWLTLDSVQAAALDPSWLQSPLVAPFELIDGLSDDGRRRLLRMFLTTAGSLYGAGRTTGYGDAVLRLAALLGAPELRPVSLCPLGASGRVLTFRVPAGQPVPRIETLVAISEDRVSRIPGFSSQEERLEQGALLHLFVPGGPGDRVMAAFGPDPLLLGSAAELGPQPLARWLARRPEATRAWATGLVDALAEADATAGALRREMRHLAAPPPELAVRHVSAAPRGVLLLADLVDPNGLVGAVRIETDAGEQDLAVPATGRGGRVTVGGFLPLTPVLPGAACRIRLVYGSGRVRTVGVLPLAAFRGTIPEGFAEIGAAAAAAVAAARSAPRGRVLAQTVEAIGAQPLRPRLSLIAAAGANPDIIRARAAQLFVEPGGGDVDLVYHVGAAQAGAVRRTLANCHAVFGIACRLLALPDDADPAERLLAALGAARGAAVLLVGADVLPAAAGWLAVWTEALKRSRAPVLAGGALLSPAGAVRDAGGAIGVDAAGGPARIERRWTGLPERDLPPASFASTGLVTAECVGLNGRAIAALRAGDGHDPDPDTLLSALAHRLRRRRGAARTLLDARFIRFGEAPGADPLAEAVTAHALGALLRARDGAGAA